MINRAIVAFIVIIVLSIVYEAVTGDGAANLPLFAAISDAFGPGSMFNTSESQEAISTLKSGRIINQ